MKPARYNIISGSLSITFFIILYYLILKISPHISDAPLFYAPLSAVLILAFNLLILSAWFSLGYRSGIVFLLFSSALTLLIGYVYHITALYLSNITFLITVFMSYKFTKASSYLLKNNKVKVEKTTESSNTLENELHKHKLQSESLNKKLERYASLKEVTELFSGSLSLDDTIKFIAERAHELVGKSDRTLFYLVDTKKQELVLKKSKQSPNFSRIKSKKGDVFDKWVLRQKVPLSMLDADKDFRFPLDEIEAREVPFKSLISHPLIAENRILGLVRMDSCAVNKFSPDDLRLLGIICDLGAVAIENATLYQRTNELAIRDSLTNLFVHRYFKERLEIELERAYLKNYSVLLLMIDIDNFKDYNDKYGHTAGDILLKRLAKMFNSLIDPGDLIARYGGEEFAILLFESDISKAKAVAENIRVKVESEKFLLRREETHVTVSIGVSIFPKDAKTSNDLIKTADQNLYKAKDTGRNKVVC